MIEHEHRTIYVGPEHWTDNDAVLAGGHTDGESEAASAFVGWIDAGFPKEVWVGSWAGPDGSATLRMRDSDLVEAAVLLLTVPLPMPGELAAKVDAYVDSTPVERDNPDPDRPMSWVVAVWDLKHALAWKQEHEPG